jgi:glycosyltransferase involved in cell wall biosynthesis
VSVDPPRIAFLTNGLGGGIGKNIVNHTNELLRRGYAVSVLVHQRIPAYERQLDKDAELVRFATSHPLAGVPALARFLRQRRPAAMRITNVRLARLALRARALARVPTRLVASVHNTYSVALREMDASKLQRRIAKWRRDYPRLDGIVAVSEGVRQDFARLTGIPIERITRIYNPVVTPELRRLAAEPVDHAWFSEEGAPVIVSVGRLSVAKNFPLLIEAFTRLREQRPARLIIVGDGDLREEIAAFRERSSHTNDIDLVGHRDNPFPFLESADLFVLSSDWEGLPTVLIEALACGAPIVSTDCPSGPREILEEGRYGRIVPTGDASALAQAMEQTLSDPPERTHQREGAERFTVERSIDAYLDLFGLARMATSGSPVVA